jgi:hypothetical protein
MGVLGSGDNREYQNIKKQALSLIWNRASNDARQRRQPRWHKACLKERQAANLANVHAADTTRLLNPTMAEKKTLTNYSQRLPSSALRRRIYEASLTPIYIIAAWSMCKVFAVNGKRGGLSL